MQPPAAVISARISATKRSLCAHSSGLGGGNSTRTLAFRREIRCNRRMNPAREQRPVALITGAAKRVGNAIARALHAAGYDLALHYRGSRAEMDALCADLEAVRAKSTCMIQAELGAV